MNQANELKKEIVSLIDDNTDVNVKAAFYGDPEVTKILDNLYERWESNNNKNEPLDYATIDELRILTMKARFYYNNPIVRKIGESPEDLRIVQEKHSLSETIKRVIKRVLLGGAD
ncbi:MAG: hypothetical protein QW128_01080 [Thermoprotei archaeon]